MLDLTICLAKVDSRYIVFFSFDYDKGYIRDIKSGGYLFVTLEQFFFITVLISMVILLILLIWFHYMDTIVAV